MPLYARAAKAKALEVYAAAIKHKLGKAKKKMAKKASARCTASNLDSENSESEELINNTENPIPRKKQANRKSILDQLEDAPSSESEDNDAMDIEENLPRKK